MPLGDPKPQTRATDRYQKKAGLIVKNFKIKKELSDEFADICKKTGKSQASVISDFMRDFIEKNK